MKTWICCRVTVRFGKYNIFFMTPSLSDLWNYGEWNLFDGSVSIILDLFTLFSPRYRDVVEDSIRIEISVIFLTWVYLWVYESVHGYEWPVRFWIFLRFSLKHTLVVPRDVLETSRTVRDVLVMSWRNNNSQICLHYPFTDWENIFCLRQNLLEIWDFDQKSDMDPQRSIFSRFRRTRALSPSQTLYPTVIEGHGQSEIDKNCLSRPNRVRDLARTHLWVITRRTLQTKIHA